MPFFIFFNRKTLEKRFKCDASNTSRNVEPMSPSHFLCPFWKPPKSSFPQNYYIWHLGALVFFNPRRFQIASKTSLRFFVDLGYRLLTSSVVFVELWTIMGPFCIEFLRCWTYTTHTTHHTPRCARSLRIFWILWIPRTIPYKIDFWCMNRNFVFSILDNLDHRLNNKLPQYNKCARSLRIFFIFNLRINLHHQKTDAEIVHKRYKCLSATELVSTAWLG